MPASWPWSLANKQDRKSETILHRQRLEFSPSLFEFVSDFGFRIFPFVGIDQAQPGSRGFDTAPRPRHTHAMQTTTRLDASNRIVLSRELRRAAGIARLQKLKVSATPGRIILEMEENSSGRVVKRGKLKVWTGSVPPTPIETAVEQARHYTR
jgi:hypothetical protein